MGFIRLPRALRFCRGVWRRAVAGRPTADLCAGMRLAVAVGSYPARLHCDLVRALVLGLLRDSQRPIFAQGGVLRSRWGSSGAPAPRSCQGACARAVAGQPTADLRTGMRPAVAAGTSGARVLQSCRGVCGRTVAGRRSQSSAPLCCAAIFAPPQILMRSSNVSAAAGLCMIHASQRRPRSLRSALIFLPPVIFVKGGMPLRGLTCR